MGLAAQKTNIEEIKIGKNEFFSFLKLMLKNKSHIMVQCTMACDTPHPVSYLVLNMLLTLFIKKCESSFNRFVFKDILINLYAT
jgi:hypothetical protein